MPARKKPPAKGIVAEEEGGRARSGQTMGLERKSSLAALLVPSVARDVRAEPQHHGIPRPEPEGEPEVRPQGGGAGFLPPGPSPVLAPAPSPGMRMREARSECEKAVLALKRGNSGKALKLAKEACAKFPDVALCSRVSGHLHLKLASCVEEPSLKHKHLLHALEAAREAAALSPSSLEFCHFHAQMLLEAALETARGQARDFHPVMKECERGLAIADPIDPATESLQEEPQGAGTHAGDSKGAAARIAAVQGELRNLQHRAHLALMLSARSSSGDENRLRFLPIGEERGDPRPGSAGVGSGGAGGGGGGGKRRVHEVRRHQAMSAEERRQQIEVRVAALRVLQQRQQQGAPELETWGNDGAGRPGAGGSKDGPGNARTGSMRGASAVAQRRKNPPPGRPESSADESVKGFWLKLGAPRKDELLQVPLSDLQHSPLASPAGGAKGGSRKPAPAVAQVVAEALLFAAEKEQWHFWQCCCCKERFTDADAFVRHVLEVHMEGLSPELQRWLLEDGDQGWVEGMRGLDPRPVDALPALAHILQAHQAHILQAHQDHILQAHQARQGAEVLGMHAGELFRQGNGAPCGEVAGSSSTSRSSSSSSSSSSSTSVALSCGGVGSSLHSGPASGTGIAPAEALPGTPVLDGLSGGRGGGVLHGRALTTSCPKPGLSSPGKGGVPGGGVEGEEEGGLPLVDDEDRHQELAALAAVVGRLAKKKVLTKEHVDRVGSFTLAVVRKQLLPELNKAAPGPQRWASGTPSGAGKEWAGAQGWQVPLEDVACDGSQGSLQQVQLEGPLGLAPSLLPTLVRLLSAAQLCEMRLYLLGLEHEAYVDLRQGTLPDRLVLDHEHTRLRVDQRVLRDCARDPAVCRVLTEPKSGKVLLEGFPDGALLPVLDVDSLGPAAGRGAPAEHRLLQEGACCKKALTHAQVLPLQREEGGAALQAGGGGGDALRGDSAWEGATDAEQALEDPALKWPLPLMRTHRGRERRKGGPTLASRAAEEQGAHMGCPPEHAVESGKGQKQGGAVLAADGGPCHAELQLAWIFGRAPYELDPTRWRSALAQAGDKGCELLHAMAQGCAGLQGLWDQRREAEERQGCLEKLQNAFRQERGHSQPVSRDLLVRPLYSLLRERVASQEEQPVGVEMKVMEGILKAFEEQVGARGELDEVGKAEPAPIALVHGATPQGRHVLGLEDPALLRSSTCQGGSSSSSCLVHTSGEKAANEAPVGAPGGEGGRAELAAQGGGPQGAAGPSAAPVTEQAGQGEGSHGEESSAGSGANAAAGEQLREGPLQSHECNVAGGCLTQAVPERIRCLDEQLESIVCKQHEDAAQMERDVVSRMGRAKEDLRKLQHELIHLLAFDYQAALLPIVKALLQRKIEKEAEQEAERTGQALVAAVEQARSSSQHKGSQQKGSRQQKKGSKHKGPVAASREKDGAVCKEKGQQQQVHGPSQDTRLQQHATVRKAKKGGVAPSMPGPAPAKCIDGKDLGRAEEDEDEGEEGGGEGAEGTEEGEEGQLREGVAGEKPGRRGPEPEQSISGGEPDAGGAPGAEGQEGQAACSPSGPEGVSRTPGAAAAPCGGSRGHPTTVTLNCDLHHGSWSGAGSPDQDLGVVARGMPPAEGCEGQLAQPPMLPPEAQERCSARPCGARAPAPCPPTPAPLLPAQALPRGPLAPSPLPSGPQLGTPREAPGARGKGPREKRSRGAKGHDKGAPPLTGLSGAQGKGIAQGMQAAKGAGPRPRHREPLLAGGSVPLGQGGPLPASASPLLGPAPLEELPGGPQGMGLLQAPPLPGPPHLAQGMPCPPPQQRWDLRPSAAGSMLPGVAPGAAGEPRHDAVPMVRHGPPAGAASSAGWASAHQEKALQNAQPPEQSSQQHAAHQLRQGQQAQEWQGQVGEHAPAVTGEHAPAVSPLLEAVEGAPGAPVGAEHPSLNLPPLAQLPPHTPFGAQALAQLPLPPHEPLAMGIHMGPVGHPQYPAQPQAFSYPGLQVLRPAPDMLAPGLHAHQPAPDMVAYAAAYTHHTMQAQALLAHHLYALRGMQGKGDMAGGPSSAVKDSSLAHVPLPSQAHQTFSGQTAAMHPLVRGHIPGGHQGPIPEGHAQGAWDGAHPEGASVPPSPHSSPSASLAAAPPTFPCVLASRPCDNATLPEAPLLCHPGVLHGAPGSALGLAASAGVQGLGSSTPGLQGEWRGPQHTQSLEGPPGEGVAGFPAAPGAPTLEAPSAGSQDARLAADSSSSMSSTGGGYANRKLSWSATPFVPGQHRYEGQAGPPVARPGSPVADASTGSHGAQAAGLPLLAEGGGDAKDGEDAGKDGAQAPAPDLTKAAGLGQEAREREGEEKVAREREGAEGVVREVGLPLSGPTHESAEWPALPLSGPTHESVEWPALAEPLRDQEWPALAEPLGDREWPALAAPTEASSAVWEPAGDTKEAWELEDEAERAFERDVQRAMELSAALHESMEGSLEASLQGTGPKADAASGLWAVAGANGHCDWREQEGGTAAAGDKLGGTGLEASSSLGEAGGTPAESLGMGLRNDTGQYNCFLNVILQSLWHLIPFRQRLLRASSLEHRHQGHPCVVCALRDIFCALEEVSAARCGAHSEPDSDTDPHARAMAAPWSAPEQKAAGPGIHPETPGTNAESDTGKGGAPGTASAVSPTPLRLALSAMFSDSEFFQEAQMNDASEVLQVLFECLHSAFADPTPAASTQDPPAQEAPAEPPLASESSEGALQDALRWPALSATEHEAGPRTPADAAHVPAASRVPAAGSHLGTSSTTKAKGGRRGPKRGRQRGDAGSNASRTSSSLSSSTSSSSTSSSSTSSSSSSSPPPSSSASSSSSVGSLPAAPYATQGPQEEVVVGAWQCEEACETGGRGAEGQVAGDGVCWAHSLFGVHILERMECSACGHRCRLHKYSTFSRIVNATALRDAKAEHPLLRMDALLRASEESDKLPCDPDTGGCGASNIKQFVLRHAPQIFTIVVGWQMARESAEDVARTVDSLDVHIDLGRVYHGILGQPQARQHATHVQPQSETGADCTFRLMSIVCYYGRHYHCFAFNVKSASWVMFDDTTVKVVGSWDGVVSSCKAGRLQPQILFYEKVESS